VEHDPKGGAQQYLQAVGSEGEGEIVDRGGGCYNPAPAIRPPKRNSGGSGRRVHAGQVEEHDA
jgi:hypothetical protein